MRRTCAPCGTGRCPQLHSCAQAWHLRGCPHWPSPSTCERSRPTCGVKGREKETRSCVPGVTFSSFFLSGSSQTSPVNTSLSELCRYSHSHTHAMKVARLPAISGSLVSCLPVRSCICVNACIRACAHACVHHKQEGISTSFQFSTRKHRPFMTTALHFTHL